MVREVELYSIEQVLTTLIIIYCAGVELEVPVTQSPTTPPVTTPRPSTTEAPSTESPSTQPSSTETLPPEPLTTVLLTTEPTEIPTTTLNPPVSVPIGVVAVNVPGVFGDVLVYWRVREGERGMSGKEEGSERGKRGGREEQGRGREWEGIEGGKEGRREEGEANRVLLMLVTCLCLGTFSSQ